mgnify:CR=1 FL=1
MTKYLFVTGGVVSSLGKGVLAASVGLLLERRGLKVAIQKIDPYLNFDPGTMNPTQHGEVYVLEDGTETDLDLGHYERFCAARLTRASSTTMGKVYQRVLDRERKGDYLGQTVQVIPHVVGELKAAIRRDGDADVVITEIGGTVGDIEALPVLEAVRQLVREVGPDHAAVVHLTYLPYLAAAGELKTKPTQHSVMELRRVGLRPDILVCRTEREDLADAERAKLALFCDVPAGCVFALPNTSPIYAVPLDLYDGGLNAAVCERLGFCGSDAEETVTAFGVCGRVDLSDWREYVARARRRYTLPVARVALVGKYDHADAYKSVLDALEHAGLAAGVRVDVTQIDAEVFDGSDKDTGELEQFDGVLVPGGFGARGVAGKVNACKVARESQIPYFGICLGLQIAVIECARNQCGWLDADSTEFAPHTPTPVVTILDTQTAVTAKGGTMRLGNYPAVPSTGTKLADAYGLPDRASVRERHRHRYEINPAYLGYLSGAGLRSAAVCLAATSDLGGGACPLVEAMERPDHPWFVGVQYHPEFNSRPTGPHPLFLGFVKAAACRAAARPPEPTVTRWPAAFTVRLKPGEVRPVGPMAPGGILAGLTDLDRVRQQTEAKEQTP